MVSRPTRNQRAAFEEAYARKIWFTAVIFFSLVLMRIPFLASSRSRSAG
jgi:hypothetical protein